MQQSPAFLRTAEKVTAYINKYIQLAGAEKREEVLDLFEKMRLLFPQWVIMTCPAMHPDILYSSENITAVLGYSKNHFAHANSIQTFFSHVHEDDRADLHACYTFVHGFSQDIRPTDYVLYRTVYHYRFIKPDSSCIYIHDEKAVLDLPGAGNLYYVLLRDVTQERSFTGVKVELFRHDNTLHKIKEYRPAALRHPLSRREGELVMLIGQGLSTKEIAGQLQISHHTVRNIKSKLFEKYKVNNSIELLNLVR
jgi:DNA-binding CsgD family transcriptional regulator